MRFMRSNQSPEAEVFWGEISPCEHLLQFYGDDSAFLDSLEGFVCGGLCKNEAIVVIATPAHRAALRDRLSTRGLDCGKLEAQGQYLDLDAEQVLQSFMKSAWPDDDRFKSVIGGILIKARAGGRHVRAFGEMVALLWAEGYHGATVRLEFLWHELCHAEGFSLFCAYPRIGDTQNASTSMKEICETHTRVLEAL